MTLRELEKALHKLSVMRSALETQKRIYEAMVEGTGKVRRKSHIEFCEKELDDFLNLEI